MTDAPYIYPAHAGINPGLPDCLDMVDDLPRTRGDKPGAELAVEVAKASTSHTRG